RRLQAIPTFCNGLTKAGNGLYFVMVFMAKAASLLRRIAARDRSQPAKPGGRTCRRYYAALIGCAARDQLQATSLERRLSVSISRRQNNCSVFRNRVSKRALHDAIEVHSHWIALGVEDIDSAGNRASIVVHERD